MRRNLAFALFVTGCVVVAMAGMTAAANDKMAADMKNTTANATATAPKNKTKTSKAACMSPYEYLNSSSLVLGKQLAMVVGMNFTGTVLLPTDKALNATLASILAVASNLTNTTITSVPAGIDLFALEALKDVLKLHATSDLVDPTTLTAATLTKAKGSLEIPVEKTKLSGVKQTLCPNTTTAELTGLVTGETLKDIVVTFTSLGGKATVVNASVDGVCTTSAVHIIDSVLLPCKTNQSIIPSLAKTIGAAATAPKANATTNSTNTASSTGYSGLSLGTMAAALFAVMFVSGTTAYTLIAAVSVIVGSLLMVLTI